MDYLSKLNLDSGRIFLIILVTLLLYKFFDVNIIKYLIIVYAFYYFNPEIFNKIILMIQNFFTDKMADYSNIILNQTNNIEEEKETINTIKNVNGNKTLAIDNSENHYDFSRNFASTNSGNRNLEAISTSNKQFDAETYNTTLYT
jgi:hypothetical protein